MNNKLNDQQANLLKQKANELGKKHRSVVLKMKKEFRIVLERALKAAALASGKAAQLKLELEEERIANHELNKKVRELSNEDANKIINELKKSLEEEIQKSTKLSDSLKNTTLQDNDIETLKQAAYQKAMTERLQEDLKTEIARNAKQRDEADHSITHLEKQLKTEIEKNDNIKQEAEESVSQIQKKLDDSLKELSLNTQEKTKEVTSLQKNEQKLESLIQENEQTIKTLESTINEQKTKIESLQKNIEELSINHKDDIENYHQLIKEQENTISKMNEFNKLFDLDTMKRDVHILKNKVNSIIKRPNQKTLKEHIKIVNQLKRTLRINVEKINELTLNFHQDLYECEKKLQNKIYKTEGPDLL